MKISLGHRQTEVSMHRDEETPVTLAALIHNESGLDVREAERLADAWMADVVAELRSSGISVIRGLGTFTLTEAGIRFEQDGDFPSPYDFPAIEGYSAAQAATAPSKPSGEAVEHDAAQPAASETGVPSDTEKTLIVDDGESSITDDVRVLEADRAVPVPEAQDEPFVTGDEESHGREASDADGDILPEVIMTGSTGFGAVDHDAVAPDEVSTEEGAPVATAHEADAMDSPASGRQADDVGVSSPSISETGAPGAAAFGVTSSGEASDSGMTDQPDQGSRTPVAAAAAPRSRSPRRYERSETGSSGRALWAIAVVAVLVASALIYRFAIAPAEDEPVLATSHEDVQPTPADSSGAMVSAGEVTDNDSTAIASDTVASEDATTSGSTNPLPDSDEGVSEKTSSTDLITRGMGGYTLIVGSTLNEETARAALATYAALGWPMGVLEYESDDVTRYRMAVGHYNTAAEADAARNQNTANLPEGTWVLSVR